MIFGKLLNKIVFFYPEALNIHKWHANDALHLPFSCDGLNSLNKLMLVLISCFFI